MPASGLLDLLPLWGVFALTLAFVLGTVEVGYRLGAWRRRRSHGEKESPVGAMVGAMLGLLAFLLAFTFGMAATRFDNRRQVQLTEANAIGTAHLRAGFLPEARREAVRALLAEYVEVRVAGILPGHLEPALQRSGELQALLWEHAEQAVAEQPSSPSVALFAESVNAVIDVHAERILVGLRSRIPLTIWRALYLIAVLSLAAMGYHSGLSGTSRSLAIVPVAIVFSLVILLIADLDRPAEGLMQIDQQAMIDLRDTLTPGR